MTAHVNYVCDLTVETPVRPTSGQCPERRKHTPSPASYIGWHFWAEKKLRTHEQVRCPGCGRLSIWKKRAVPLTEAEVELALAPGD